MCFDVRWGCVVRFGVVGCYVVRYVVRFDSRFGARFDVHFGVRFGFHFEDGTHSAPVARSELDTRSDTHSLFDSDSTSDAHSALDSACVSEILYHLQL